MDTSNKSTFRILGVIPARFNSTRLPGKALVNIGNKPMVLHVLERAKRADCLTQIVVATDDERIFDVVTTAGGHAAMTSDRHPSGTDRCAEALEKYEEQFDAVINIQGDEPFIHPEQIDLVGELLAEGADIATLVKSIENEDELFSPNTVKAAVSRTGQALYFSRHPIPYYRNAPQKEWIQHGAYYKHIGIYGYRRDVLKALTKLMVSPLELSESLEQLRWLDHGYKIQTAVTHYESIGVDTPEDLKLAESLLAQHKL
jgi:3-deoxy-manno-octulosonate cytidylyltransferase (CMP-KDO synthetase)